MGVLHKRPFRPKNPCSLETVSQVRSWFDRACPERTVHLSVSKGERRIVTRSLDGGGCWGSIALDTLLKIVPWQKLHDLSKDGLSSIHEPSPSAMMKEYGSFGALYRKKTFMVKLHDI